MQRSIKNLDYIEDHADAPVSSRLARAKRDIDFNAKLRPLPARSTDRRPDIRIPMQNYIRDRFSSETRNGAVFKLLRAENQRRLNLCVARGNVQLSRTSGDWHPITPAEIAAIKAAEEAASQNSTPPRKAPKRLFPFAGHQPVFLEHATLIDKAPLAAFLAKVMSDPKKADGTSQYSADQQFQAMHHYAALVAADKSEAK